jgi:hypothetical protein
VHDNGDKYSNEIIIKVIVLDDAAVKLVLSKALNAVFTLLYYAEL